MPIPPGGRTLTQKYEFGKDNLPSKYHISSTRNHTYSYDSLNRLKSTVINTETPINIDYLYWLSSGRNSADETNIVLHSLIPNISVTRLTDMFMINWVILSPFRREQGEEQQTVLLFPTELIW